MSAPKAHGTKTEQQPLLLDHDHPWPGLVSFTEANKSYFFGREREVEELARLVRQETLTVFFGKSGLGKSSILRAGLAPLLRTQDFVPVYIRLNYDDAAPPLEDQVEMAIENVLAREQIDAPKPIRAETLWEYFHKNNNDWWDANNRLVKPVLIFDQFEELLTLGQESPTRAARSASFLTELEDLVEGRPPVSLAERFKTDRNLRDQFDQRRSDYRVILSLREDFLPDLEGLRDRLRPIMVNRLRLLPMTGEQALDVVLKAGHDLVEEDVAIRIVDFVSSSERSRLQKQVGRAQIAKRSIEPALLSVVLQELNNRRIQAGQQQITSELVGKTNASEIFQDFYLRGLAGMDGEVREFIEDCLLTSSGARNRIAEEDALTKRGISSEVVTTLIDRRIIQREITGNTKWLELTHDTLADVVRADRAQHRQQRQLEQSKAREAEARQKLRKAQKLTIAFAVLLVIAAVALWRLATRVEAQARETVTSLNTELAMPAPGASERVQKAIRHLANDVGYFFFLPDLKVTDAQALGCAAQILHFNGRISESYDYATKAVTLADKYRCDDQCRANARYALANAQLETGKLKEAEQNFRDAARLVEPLLPKSETAKRIRILSLLGVGDVKLKEALRDEASRTYDQVLSELRKWYPNSEAANKVAQNAVIYEVAALRGKGIAQGRSGLLIEDISGGQQAKEDFLEEAEREISSAAREHPDDLRLRDALAETAYWRMFFLIDQRGIPFTQVATRLREAVRQGETLSHLDEQNQRWKLLLAQIYRSAGMLSKATHDDRRASERFGLMAKLTREIRAAEPAWVMNNYLYAISDSYIADCVMTVATTTEMQAFRSYLKDLSGNRTTTFQKLTASLEDEVSKASALPEVSARQEKVGQALAGYKVEVYRSVVSNLKRLVQDAPGHSDFERTTASITAGAAQLEKEQKDEGRATADYQDALRTWNSIAEAARPQPDFQGSAAMVEESLAGILLEQGNFQGALDLDNRALQRRRQLEKEHPSVDNLAAVAGTEIYLGDIYLKKGLSEEAKQHYRVAADLYEKELAATPLDATVGSNLSRRATLFRAKAQALNYVASQWRAVPNLTEALINLRAAIDATGQALREDPLNLEVVSFLNNIIGDEKNPNWKHFCDEQLRKTDLNPADKEQLQSIAGLLTPAAINQTPELTGSGSINWSILPLIPGEWVTLGPQEKAAEMRYLSSSEIRPPIQPAQVARIRTLGLPCYPDTNLYEAELTDPPRFLDYMRAGDTREPLRDFSAVSSEEVSSLLKDSARQVNGVRLDGTSTPIRIFNAKHPPLLENEVSAAIYLRLFCNFLQGFDGIFRIVDTQADLHWRPGADEKLRQKIDGRIYPLKMKASSENWQAKATMVYSNVVKYALLTLSATGDVTIVKEDDMPVPEIKEEELPIEPEAFVNGFHVVGSSPARLVQEDWRAASAAMKSKKWLEACEHLKSAVEITNQPQYWNTEETLLARLWNSLSWSELHARKPDEALHSSEAALKIQPDNLMFQTNHVHALLFLGRTSEAEKLYRANMGKVISAGGEKQTWEKAILDDFDDLEKAGVTHPDLNRIRTILKGSEP